MPTISEIRQEYITLSARVNYGVFEGKPASVEERLRLRELSRLLVDAAVPDFRSAAALNAALHAA
jgi:hypothetical protein